MHLRIIALLVIVCTSIRLEAQSSAVDFGIERFGLTVDEPFHTARYMYQDSLGQIVAYTNEDKNETLTFDGKAFKKKAILKPSERMLMRSDNGGYWKMSDPFIATYVKEGKEVSLDVRQYLERNICHLYIVDEHYYLLANDGYIKFDMIDNTIQVVEHHQYPVTRIVSAYFSGDTIFIKRGDRVAYILEDNPEEIVYTEEQALLPNNVISLTNGRLVINDENSAKLLPKSSSINEYLRLHTDYLMSPFIDSKGRLWCNLRTDAAPGLYVFDPKSGEHQIIDLGIEKRNMLSVFEDKIGDIWVSTSTQGIVHLYEQSIRLINKSNGADTDNISAVYQDEASGHIYTSMNYQGIDIFDSKAEQKIGHIEGEGSMQSILKDGQGRMWVISSGVSLIKDNKIVRRYTKRDGFHSGTINTLFEDSRGDIWAGTRQVLHKYQDDRWEKFQIPGLDVYDRIIGIAEIENNDLLLAIDLGTYYTFNGKEFTKLDVPKVIPNKLFTDREGTIWLATDNGLLFWDDGTFAGSSPYLDIPIKNLQDSHNGLLFGLCTENRIFYANKSDLKTNSNPKSIKWLSIDSGLPLMASERSRHPSTALLSSGEVVFPNVYGAIVIDPRKIFEKKQPFHLAVMMNGKVINNQKVSLEYGDNDIVVSLRNIYMNPQASFANQYMINNQKWVDLNGALDIDLHNLESGLNKIKVRAKHVNGEWLRPTEFMVNVPRLFYERWWFIFGVPVFLFLFIYNYVKYRMRIIKARNHELKKQVDEQTRELLMEKQQLAETLVKQKELTKELNLSQASKNRMYAQISHEFKSPLQAIKSHLSKTEGYLTGEDRNRVKGNIENLLGISKEIMQLSKAESGNLKIKKNWYNINGIINDQVELMSQLAEEKQITIHQPSKNNRQYLRLDVSLIQKVMNNLLSNAIKFSPIGGAITINSIIKDGIHQIEVMDQGPGIPSSEIENLTLAYYQASNNTMDGTGIGLSLVKEILKLHDSELTITSEIGHGSTFRFMLQRPDVSQEEILKKSIDLGSLSKQMESIINPDRPIILAVDDSQDVLYFLKQALSSRYNVLTSMNGREALLALDRLSPAAIISDLNMPLMNGIALLKEVRAIPKFQALPFLFLTGSSSEVTELQSIKAGADIILQKPIQESILVSQVAQLLKRQKTISEAIKKSFAHDLLPANINNDDIQLMSTLEGIFLHNIENGQLKSEEIAQMMGIGEKTLRNRVKAITGLTLVKYFRNFRLEKAKLLLEEGYGNMGEVATATGFSSLSYFSKCYNGYFGK